MRKTIFLVCMAALFAIGTAGAARLTVSDIYYNETYSCWCVEIGMDNPGVEVCAFQCDMAIPATFTFASDGAGSYQCAMSSRVPQTTNALNQTVCSHYCTSALRSNGTLRSVLYSSANTPLLGTSGTVLLVVLQPVDEASVDRAQTYGANLTNQVLTSVSGDAVKTACPDGVINDPTLTCYDSMGNHVVWYANATDGRGYTENEDALSDDLEAIRSDIATNSRVVTVDLRNLYYMVNPDVVLKAANPNALFFLLFKEQLGNTQNTFYVKDRGSLYCSDLVLYDNDNGSGLDGLSFEMPFDVPNTVERFTLARSFPGGQWSSVVLPVTLSEEQAKGIIGGGVRLACLSGYDPETATVSYSDADSFEANKPYLVLPAASSDVFSGLTSVSLKPTAALSTVDVGRMSMVGCYDYRTISSTADTLRYGYDATTGEFVKIGRNAHVNPFRCYLELTGTAVASAPHRIAIAGNPDDTTTDGIDSIQGTAARDDIYTLDGRRLQTTDIRRLTKGVYIVNGRKLVVR